MLRNAKVSPLFMLLSITYPHCLCYIM